MEYVNVKFFAITSPDLPVLPEDAVDELSSDQYYGHKFV